ncbi:MAG TPA: OsmC family peroxiredoxin [Myxococcaceae bacterium]|nr:OsmC family peroxiredoxin [Myxococcaceae bacterium]
MAAIRSAAVVWEGDLFAGRGHVTASTSGILREQPVTWASRTEAPYDRTSPEELLAAAHATCFSMALAHALGEQKKTPTRLEVTAMVTFDRVGEGWKVTSSALEVRGTVPGLDADTFQRAAEGAKDGCPISQALKGNVQLSVKATLVG